MPAAALTPELQKKQQYCSGCRDDFYNRRETPGFDGATHCWSLDNAEVVTRYRIGWWTQPTSASVFQKVTTLSCHYAPGQYAHFKELPEHCRGKR